MGVVGCLFFLYCSFGCLHIADCLFVSFCTVVVLTVCR